jgi:predicted transcriptional regulator
MNQHRLIFDEQVVVDDFKADRDKPLFYQMTRITKDRGAIPKDDRLDALAMAVNFHTERMDADSIKSLRDHRAAAMDEELEKCRWLKPETVEQIDRIAEKAHLSRSKLTANMIDACMPDIEFLESMEMVDVLLFLDKQKTRIKQNT